MLYSEGDYAGGRGALSPLPRNAQERTLGKEHPDTLQSVNNLADVLENKGDFAGAEALYQRCLEARERVLGKEHLGTGVTAFNFSLLEQKQGKLREALPLAEEAVVATAVNLPTDHPDRLKYQENLQNLRAKLASAAPHP